MRAGEREKLSAPQIFPRSHALDTSGVGRGVFQKLKSVVRSPTAGLLPGMYGVGPGAGLGRLSRLVADKGWRLQLYSMNSVLAYLDTTRSMIRGPSPKKSLG